MMLYLKWGRSLAVHVEWSADLSARPWFRTETCRGEKILDMPYCRMIFTYTGHTRPDLQRTERCSDD